MKGFLEDAPHIRILYSETGIHDHHPLRNLSHDTKIMGNQYDGGVILLLKIFKEMHDLSLYGDIESRSGLIRDQNVGIAGKCHGDHDTLSHTA